MTRAHSSSAHKLLTLRIHIYPQSGGRPGHHLSHTHTTPQKSRHMIWATSGAIVARAPAAQSDWAASLSSSQRLPPLHRTSP